MMVDDGALLGSQTWLLLYSCRHCQKGVVATLRDRGSQKTPGSVDTNLLRHFIVVSVHPQPQSVDAPEHTPSNIRKTYLEAVTALANGLCDPAGMTFRKVLERTTLALGPGSKSFKGKFLKQRIDSLAEQHIITEAMRDWAHHIRLVGIDASHDDGEITLEEANELREFTELFLIYTFTLPKRVEVAKEVREQEEAE